ncbi:hypothetical protein HW555_009466 [Spodoptera exigua]|uniref:Uncharacterized protein n=1 Tax=Spodoptera exigua TaxID=7107 RepID=A0A835L3I0_SPOEX|nr:hypothetical protein HW555_009466 [Spodoptera exigua]
MIRKDRSGDSGWGGVLLAVRDCFSVREITNMDGLTPDMELIFAIIGVKHRGMLDLVLSDLSLDQMLVSVGPEPLVPIDEYHPPIEVLIRFPCGSVATPVPSSSSAPLSTSSRCSWNWRKADLQGLYTALQHLDWSELFLFNDIEIAIDIFYTNLYNCISLYVPVKTDRMKDSKWHVKNLVDNAYKQHLHLTGRKIADDPAKFWEFIKDRKNDRRFVEFYSFRNEEVTGQAAADAFAEYFSSVFQSEVPLLNPLDASLAASSHADATLISVSEFSESDLRLAARRLKPKSSGGPDGIPVFLAKDCISILKDPILYLFNLSLARSTYSEYGYYPYLYPSSFVAGMVDLETLKFRRVVQTIVHYLSIVHHKVDNPIVLGMVRLLVPKRLAWNEQGQFRRGVGLAFCGGLKRAPTMRCMHRLFGHWALLRI